VGTVRSVYQIIDDLRAGFPIELLSYFEVFTKRTISAEQFSDYVESLRWTDDQILESLDAAGITRSLITGSMKSRRAVSLSCTTPR
jgi:hypothetical protein